MLHILFYTNPIISISFAAKLQHGAQRNTKIYIRDFCLLILKLIQSPDLECQELLDFLYSGQYEIDSSLLKEFELTLKVIPKHSPEFFLDIIKSIATLTQPEDGPSFTIGIHSVTGNTFYFFLII